MFDCPSNRIKSTTGCGSHPGLRCSATTLVNVCKRGRVRIVFLTPTFPVPIPISSSCALHDSQCSSISARGQCRRAPAPETPSFSRTLQGLGGPLVQALPAYLRRYQRCGMHFRRNAPRGNSQAARRFVVRPPARPVRSGRLFESSAREEEKGAALELFYAAHTAACCRSGPVTHSLPRIPEHAQPRAILISFNVLLCQEYFRITHAPTNEHG